MWKLICLSALLVLSYQSHAEAQSNPPQASKFGEFIYVTSSDAKAWLDNFAVQLQNQPNARGFIMVYRSQRDLPGLSSRLAHLMAGYMIYNRGILKKDIVPIDSGVASCLTVELWVVPVGATPKPRSDAFADWYQDFESTRKFDEHHYSLPSDQWEDGGFSSTEDLSSYLDAFGEALRKDLKSRAYIIAYTQHYVERWEETDDEGKKIKTHRKVYLDPPGIANRMLEREKSYLVDKHGIPPSRIKVVKGGYRKWREVELWLVPEGEFPPVPTPSRYPRVK